ncbi:MAG: hypothetical protein WBA08_06205, partial [Candidatus Sulfotelmatobacter sp.]
MKTETTTNNHTTPTTHYSIFEVDVNNMRKIMAARDKIFIIREMVQNAWDENITRVDILLTPPDENGHSIIKVTDDSPGGWLSLEHAYTMYAESTKANDPTKRGRFNEGEKNVLCLAIEASVTTVSGQVCFDRTRGRWAGTERRKRGSEFYMKFELTQKEYASICQKTRLLIPPKDVVSTFNGVELVHRAPDLRFETRLRTPRDGRNEPRKTEVRLYNVAAGEQAWLYEMGIPVVELSDDKWHINVMQKMPVGRDRDNVNPSYIGDIRVAIFNEFYTKLSPQDASLLSIQAAASHPKSKTDAVKANLAARFGEKYALEDPTDPGSKEEFVSQGGTVIQRNDLSPEMKKRLRKIKDEQNPRKSFVKRTGELTPTNVKVTLDKVVDPGDYDDDTANYVALVERLAPRVINRPVKAIVIDDPDAGIRGCFEFHSGEMHINLDCHDTSDNVANYWLMIHEFAHNTVNSNAHLKDVFYKTEEEIAGKLLVLALNEPELFIGANRCDFTDVRPLLGAHEPSWA